MSRRANSAARTPAVRHARISFTDRGDLIVRVPAGLVELLTVLAALVGLALLPFAVAGLVAATVIAVAALPLALLGVSALLAAALFAPFALLAAVAALLG